MYRPVLSKIFACDNDPTYNRENKNFAEFEKNRLENILQRK